MQCKTIEGLYREETWFCLHSNKLTLAAFVKNDLVVSRGQDKKQTSQKVFAGDYGELDYGGGNGMN